MPILSHFAGKEKYRVLFFDIFCAKVQRKHKRSCNLQKHYIGNRVLQGGDITCRVNYRWNQRIKKQTFSSGFRTSVARPSEFPGLPSWGAGVLSREDFSKESGSADFSFRKSAEPPRYVFSLIPPAVQSHQAAPARCESPVRD